MLEERLNSAEEKKLIVLQRKRSRKLKSALKATSIITVLEAKELQGKNAPVRRCGSYD